MTWLRLTRIYDDHGPQKPVAVNMDSVRFFVSLPERIDGVPRTRLVFHGDSYPAETMTVAASADALADLVGAMDWTLDRTDA